MSDFEKKFELLKHHEVVPPPTAWEQLNGRLEQKRKRKAMTYWRVAAVVTLLLLSSIALLLLRDGNQTSPMTVSSVPADSTVGVAQPAEPNHMAEIPTIASSEEKASTDTVLAPQDTKPVVSPLAQRGTLLESENTQVPAKQEKVPVSEDHLTQLAESTVSMAPPDAAQPAESRSGMTTVGAAQPGAAQPTQKERNRQLPSRVMPSSVAPASAPVADRAEENIEVAALPESQPVAVADDDSEQSRTEPTMASSPESSPVAQRRTITVIYKPGGQRAKAKPSASETGLFAKTLSFLDDVKENGIGYSELRSAKSELVDQVFSRKSE